MLTSWFEIVALIQRRLFLMRLQSYNACFSLSDSNIKIGPLDAVCGRGNVSFTASDWPKGQLKTQSRYTALFKQDNGLIFFFFERNKV